VKELTQLSLREQAAEAIRAGIVSGELDAGEIFSAVSIAASLGVSATPVREAMLDLANAGLILPVRNRGYRIVEVSDRDLDENIELRIMLEVPAMALVVERAPAEALGPFRPMVDDMEDAARGGDIGRFLTVDRTFHLGLLELTGNARLVKVVGELRDQTRLVGLRALARSGELVASATEHRPLLDALVGGDADLAQRLMRDHLRHARGNWAGREAPAAPALSRR
jgi:DNA-binding GntR family transcriptional regulator